MNHLPTGTVTFLFTDIEGSTPLAQQYPIELPALLARHHAILREAIQAHNGSILRVSGDAFVAAFYTAAEALRTDSGSPMMGAEYAEYEREVAALRGDMDEEVFEAGWESGGRLTLEQAIQAAL